MRAMSGDEALAFTASGARTAKVAILAA